MKKENMLIDGKYILNAEEARRNVNLYNSLYDRFYSSCGDDDRISYLCFIYDEDLGGISPQILLERGSMFTIGKTMTDEDATSVLYELISKWLQVPKIENEKEQYVGKFNGKTIHFNREYAGYRFSDEECKRLLNGETIIITLTGADGNYRRAGRLDKSEYQGFKYWGFQWDKSIKLCPLQFAGHTFTTQELEQLESGKSIYCRDLYSRKKNDYFSATIEFDKELGKIEFVNRASYGNGDADNIG